MVFPEEEISSERGEEWGMTSAGRTEHKNPSPWSPYSLEVIREELREDHSLLK
jgi:hypothetical protein